MSISGNNLNQKVHLNLFVLNEYILEYIALFDLITDAIITYNVIQTPNTMWASITVCAMAAPQLVSSFQMIKFLLNKVITRDRSVNNSILLFIACISITPVFIIFLTLMDIYFILNSTIFVLIALILGRFINVTFLTDSMEYSYMMLFHMSKQEMTGVRHMRTITQLAFESIIQFAVQVDMLVYY